MEALSWFGFNDLGHLGCNSVDAHAALLFLGKLKHSVTEFATLDGAEEVNQLWEGEEPLWVAHNYHTVSSVIETADNKLIVALTIEFEGGGQINYSYGELYVHLPESHDIISSTEKLLAVYGYYAPIEIINFCLKHRGKHYLPFVLGMHPEDITDELERMLEHSRQLDSEEMGA